MNRVLRQLSPVVVSSSILYLIVSSLVLSGYFRIAVADPFSWLFYLGILLSACSIVLLSQVRHVYTGILQIVLVCLLLTMTGLMTVMYGLEIILN
ncbi:hypothetical protein [Exiguobacterium sp. S90]|uniref:hypothetical protein n=1 Tax=Exiguobacterium sp. S90 TaxID=1221231 RepID=UPI001BE806E7|nr:hypothetical protein [Exiguobacterium sp. S90]